jgi:hypothetical protein
VLIQEASRSSFLSFLAAENAIENNGRAAAFPALV